MVVKWRRPTIIFRRERKKLARKVAKRRLSCESKLDKVVDRGAARKSSARRGRPEKSCERPSRRNEAPGAAHRWAAGKYLADSWRRRPRWRLRASEALSVVTERTTLREPFHPAPQQLRACRCGEELQEVSSPSSRTLSRLQRDERAEKKAFSRLHR